MWIHILISVAISVVYQFSAFIDNPEFNIEFFLLVIIGGLKLSLEITAIVIK